MFPKLFKSYTNQAKNNFKFLKPKFNTKLTDSFDQFFKV